MTTLTSEKKRAIIEAALMVSGQTLTISNLAQLFEDEDEAIDKNEIKSLLDEIAEKYQDSGIELKEVASGFRFQARKELSQWLHKLWSERPPRYSRALLETLAIIAYKQPVTRAEIEEIRGVTVSTNIIKTLQEREWIKAVGVRDIPGKPSIYGTTKQFLDYFNLKSLTELPTLAEFREISAQDKDVQVQLALEESNVGPSDSEMIPEENQAEALSSEAAPSTENASFEEPSNIVTLHPEQAEEIAQSEPGQSTEESEDNENSEDHSEQAL